MNNEQILLEKWRTLSSDKQQEVLEFINSLEVLPTYTKPYYEPKTELGRKLWHIRNRAIAEGKIKLLDWKGIEKEIAERRGETE